MARYIREETLNQPLDVVSEIMENYIYRNRYFRTDWQGEPVYLSAEGREEERYFKWYYTNGVIHIEAWMKGKFGKEADLNGGGKKQAYRENIEQLIRTLKNPPQDEYSHQSEMSQDEANGFSEMNRRAADDTFRPVYTESWMEGRRSAYSYSSRGSVKTPTGAPMGVPVESIRNATENGAVRAVFYALIAVFLAFMSPLLGLFMGISGLNRSKKAMVADATDTKGKIAKYLSIAAIIIVAIRLAITFLFPILIIFLNLL